MSDTHEQRFDAAGTSRVTPDVVPLARLGVVPLAGLGDVPGAGRPAATATTPHVVVFGVAGHRDLRRLLAAAGPGSKTAVRRVWWPEPPLRRGRVSLWFWCHDEQRLRERAPRVLREFVHPLLAQAVPYCIGFPFGEEVFARRPLGFADAAALDLEDIGALLRRGPRTAARVDWSGLPGRAAVAGRRAAILSELDDRQRAAVAHACGPARVLAPAGSGKTKTLVSRVVELVGRGVDPGAILLLAFNRKAAEQLEERLAALDIATTRRIRREDGDRLGELASAGAADAVPAPRGAVHCATFNAFGARYQKEVAGARIELAGDAGLRGLMRQAVSAVMTGTAAADVAHVDREADPTAACLQALTRVRAGLEPPEGIAIAGTACVRSGGAGEEPAALPFANVHAAYSRLQAHAGVQAFDDQIYFALADMLAAPEHRAFIQRRYEHVLVDEFQDLNPAQLLLVDLLSRPSRDLFVVGDDDQLIYGWRLADIDGILGFHEHMPPRPWSATYLLATNYRCSREVIATSDRLIRHNRRRETKQIRPREGAPEGEVRLAGAAAWPERAALMCAFLREQRARLGCDWRALAVLCRYRAQQLPLALALDRASVPRGPVEGGRLFSHPAAQLVRSRLDLVLGATACAEDAPATTGEDRVRLLAVRERVGEGAAASAAEALWAVAEGCRLGDRWRAEAAATGGGEHEAAATGGEHEGPADPFRVFDALLLLAGDDPLPAFLADWDRLAAEEGAAQQQAALRAGVAEPTAGLPEADGVAIGTIHAAKGREYRAVVVPDYWCDLRRLESAQVEEERRVLYVAVTRAQDAALLTVDTSRRDVHPFLRELAGPPDRLSGRPDELALLYPTPARRR